MPRREHKINLGQRIAALQHAEASHDNKKVVVGGRRLILPGLGPRLTSTTTTTATPTIPNTSSVPLLSSNQSTATSWKMTSNEWVINDHNNENEYSAKIHGGDPPTVQRIYPHGRGVRSAVRHEMKGNPTTVSQQPPSECSGNSNNAGGVNQNTYYKERLARGRLGIDERIDVFEPQLAPHHHKEYSNKNFRTFDATNRRIPFDDDEENDTSCASFEFSKQHQQPRPSPPGGRHRRTRLDGSLSIVAEKEEEDAEEGPIPLKSTQSEDESEFSRTSSHSSLTFAANPQRTHRRRRIRRRHKNGSSRNLQSPLPVRTSVAHSGKVTQRNTDPIGERQTHPSALGSIQSAWDERQWNRRVPRENVDSIENESQDALSTPRIGNASSNRCNNWTSSSTNTNNVGLFEPPYNLPSSKTGLNASRPNKTTTLARQGSGRTHDKSHLTKPVLGDSSALNVAQNNTTNPPAHVPPRHNSPQKVHTVTHRLNVKADVFTRRLPSPMSSDGEFNENLKHDAFAAFDDDDEVVTVPSRAHDESRQGSQATGNVVRSSQTRSSDGNATHTGRLVESSFDRNKHHQGTTAVSFYSGGEMLPSQNVTRQSQKVVKSSTGGHRVEKKRTLESSVRPIAEEMRPEEVKLPNGTFERSGVSLSQREGETSFSHGQHPFGENVKTNASNRSGKSTRLTSEELDFHVGHARQRSLSPVKSKSTDCSDDGRRTRMLQPLLSRANGYESGAIKGTRSSFEAVSVSCESMTTDFDPMATSFRNPFREEVPSMSTSFGSSSEHDRRRVPTQDDMCTTSSTRSEKSMRSMIEAKLQNRQHAQYTKKSTDSTDDVATKLKTHEGGNGFQHSKDEKDVSEETETEAIDRLLAALSSMTKDVTPPLHIERQSLNVPKGSSVQVQGNQCYTFQKPDPPNSAQRSISQSSPDPLASLPADMPQKGILKQARYGSHSGHTSLVRRNSGEVSLPASKSLDSVQVQENSPLKAPPLRNSQPKSVENRAYASAPIRNYWKEYSNIRSRGSFDSLSLAHSLSSRKKDIEEQLLSNDAEDHDSISTFTHEMDQPYKHLNASKSHETSSHISGDIYDRNIGRRDAYESHEKDTIAGQIHNPIIESRAVPKHRSHPSHLPAATTHVSPPIDSTSGQRTLLSSDARRDGEAEPKQTIGPRKFVDRYEQHNTNRANGNFALPINHHFSQPEEAGSSNFNAQGATVRKDAIRTATLPPPPPPPPTNHFVQQHANPTGSMSSAPHHSPYVPSPTRMTTQTTPITSNQSQFRSSMLFKTSEVDSRSRGRTDDNMGTSAVQSSATDAPASGHFKGVDPPEDCNKGVPLQQNTRRSSVGSLALSDAQASPEDSTSMASCRGSPMTESSFQHDLPLNDSFDSENAIVDEIVELCSTSSSERTSEDYLVLKPSDSSDTAKAVSQPETNILPPRLPIQEEDYADAGGRGSFDSATFVDPHSDGTGYADHVTQGQSTNKVNHWLLPSPSGYSKELTSPLRDSLIHAMSPMLSDDTDDDSASYESRNKAEGSTYRNCSFLCESLDFSKLREQLDGLCRF